MASATEREDAQGRTATPGDATGSVGPASPGAASVRISDVDLSFRGDGATLHALKGMSLTAEPGEVIALIGPNGCGKSTLLRVIAGLLPPDRGEVLVGDRPVRGPDPRVGLVFQDPRLLPWRSAFDNLRFPMELAGWPMRRQRERTRDLLGLVGLSEVADRRPGALSGGMRQRLAIARSLALEPGVLLLDEPFSALDALTRERFNVELLRLWSRTGTTIVMVTHSIPEAVFLADHVVVMTPRPGRVARVVTVDLPRPRHLAQLDSAIVSRTAAEIRSHLEDRTDDRVALEEAAAFVRPAHGPGPATGAASGTPAWFDPFSDEGER
jgi:NitT/TauT family transport system ATP-binding protein